MQRVIIAVGALSNPVCLSGGLAPGSLSPKYPLFLKKHPVLITSLIAMVQLNTGGK